MFYWLPLLVESQAEESPELKLLLEHMADSLVTALQIQSWTESEVLVRKLWSKKLCSKGGLMNVNRGLHHFILREQKCHCSMDTYCGGFVPSSPVGGHTCWTPWNVPKEKSCNNVCFGGQVWMQTLSS